MCIFRSNWECKCPPWKWCRRWSCWSWGKNGLALGCYWGWSTQNFQALFQFHWWFHVKIYEVFFSLHNVVGQTRIADILIEKGAKYDIADKYGLTAKQIALNGGIIYLSNKSKCEINNFFLFLQPIPNGSEIWKIWIITFNAQ